MVTIQRAKELAQDIQANHPNSLLSQSLNSSSLFSSLQLETSGGQGSPGNETVNFIKENTRRPAFDNCLPHHSLFQCSDDDRDDDANESDDHGSDGCGEYFD